MPAPVGALEEPDDVKVKSAAIINSVDSQLSLRIFGLMSFPSNCQHHHFQFPCISKLNEHTILHHT